MRNNINDVVLSVITGFPLYKELKYMELGCGDAGLVEKLQAQGCIVRGTTWLSREKDYIRGRTYPKLVEKVIDYGIDLNAPLPYANSSFDVVYSIEVIEHIEGHRNFICEVSRILKSKGKLVLTAPNLHRLISRIHYALSGVHLVKERQPSYNVPLDRMGEYHIRCPEFTVLHWLLWQSGLKITKIYPEYIHPVSRLLMVLMPLIKIASRNAVSRYLNINEANDDAIIDLKFWLESSALLQSERFCLVAEKF